MVYMGKPFLLSSFLIESIPDLLLVVQGCRASKRPPVKFDVVRHSSLVYTPHKGATPAHYPAKLVAHLMGITARFNASECNYLIRYECEKHIKVVGK